MSNSQISMADGGKPYGGFWRRFFAAIIDGLILWIPIVPIMLAGGFMEIMSMDPEYLMANPEAAQLPVWVGIASAVVVLVYKIAFETSNLRATPGKLLFGMRVTDGTGAKLSFVPALVRSWPWWAGSLILVVDSLLGTGQILSNSVSVAALLSGLIIAFTPHKQGFHDMMAKALVVKKAAQFGT